MEKLKVLFVCVENSFRSQMSEGVARKYFGDRIEPYSAGSKPSGKIHPAAITALKEIGVDISLQSSKGFGAFAGMQFDYVVTMGCGDVCPFFPSKKHLDWDLPDIKNEPAEKVRALRDNIRERINGIVEMEKNGH
jgi:arsenate reductase (thioredoxin)